MDVGQNLMVNPDIVIGDSADANYGNIWDNPEGSHEHDYDNPFSSPIGHLPIVGLM